MKKHLDKDIIGVITRDGQEIIITVDGCDAQLYNQLIHETEYTILREHKIKLPTTAVDVYKFNGEFYTKWTDVEEYVENNRGNNLWGLIVHDFKGELYLKLDDIKDKYNIYYHEHEPQGRVRIIKLK